MANDGTGCTPYAFYGASNKTVGISPEGKTRVPLRGQGKGKNTGGHHVNMKSPEKKRTYNDENKFYTAQTYRGKYIHLLLALTNLKNRIDDYYNCKARDRDNTHFVAINFQIQKCIDMLQKMNAFPEEQQDFSFIERLNKAFLSHDYATKLYNPIDLRPYYNGKNYLSYNKAQMDHVTGAPSRLTEDAISDAPLNEVIIQKMNLPTYCGITPLPVATPSTPSIPSKSAFLDWCENYETPPQN